MLHHKNVKRIAYGHVRAPTVSEPPTRRTLQLVQALFNVFDGSVSLLKAAAAYVNDTPVKQDKWNQDAHLHYK